MLGTCQIQKIVLQNASEEEKVSNLYYNSDSSASLSFWLISIPGTTIRISRICGYMVSATVTSLIANVIGRLLTVQDPNRFIILMVAF
jgi:hypothetical protein